jgi:hypothetical protein
MKLTIETIKKLIKEELQKESKYRKIIAPGPGPLGLPREKASTITYDDPSDLLSPDIQKKFPKGSSRESYAQAYDLQRAMDPEFEKDVPLEKEEEAEQDFLDSIEKSRQDPIGVAIEEINNEIRRISREWLASKNEDPRELLAKVKELQAKRDHLKKLAYKKKSPYGEKS